jgi:uncharacterized membrane protein
MAAHMRPRRRRLRNAEAVSVARGLGWFSVGLGVAQILAPRAVCRLAGMPPVTALTRLCGVRELVCGIGILTGSDAAPWMKARVAGDVMDLACLAGAAPFARADRGRIAVACGAVAGVTALDVYCSRALADKREVSPLHVRATIVVNKTRQELYGFWRDLSNLPRVMPHLQSVQILDGGRSRWVAQGPGGVPIEWDSEIIDDRPNDRLAWRSLEASDVYSAGSVRFDPVPGEEGTYVTVELLYDPPGGTIGDSLAKLLGSDAESEIQDDLRAFEELMETGEIASRTNSGQPRFGMLKRLVRLMR